MVRVIYVSVMNILCVCVCVTMQWSARARSADPTRTAKSA